MSRICGLVLALSASTLIAQEPTFRGGARFVRVDVYPTDSAGKPIEGLTAADFEVFEDGKPQAIDTFEFVRVEAEPEVMRTDPNTQKEGEALAKDPRARVFAIVLDTRHVDVASSHAMKQPLTEMLDQMIGPRDLFGVITPELPPGSFVLGRRATTVADMMERHWSWGTYDSILPQDATEALFDGCFGPVTDPKNVLTQELMARYRERQTLEFLNALVTRLQAIREERKSVVLVTQGWRLFGPNNDAANEVGRLMDGGRPLMGTEGAKIRMGGINTRDRLVVDTSECLSQATSLLLRDSRSYHRDLMTKAQRANVAFYPVDPRGLSPFDQPISHGVIAPSVENARLQARVEGLQELAENTDGRAFVRNNDLREQFTSLARNLSTYYLLGYYSTNTKFDGGFRRLQVKVRKPGVRLTARRGYFAPTEAEIASIAAGRDAASRPPAPEAAGLSAALARLGELTHTRDLFVQASRVNDGIAISAELGVNARTSAAWADGGEVRVTIKAASGDIVETRPIEAIRSGTSLRLAVTQPRAVRIEVAARGKRGGPSSAADAIVNLPAQTPALLGDPMSYRGIARALVPAADGRYRRTERATIEATLASGAAPAGARLLDKSGNPLNIPVETRERVDAAGTRWMVVSLPLAPFTDGDYVIELEAVRDATRERRLFALRVVR
ncbi:MAG: VWA domain-containing protein [Acidobacteriota bacterium]|nr:VWA domain-containing protein [Acidobacteriota bacterium]